MPVIAAFNSKGGSAKSTTLIVLADALARQNASVTVIDTDPQRSIAHFAAQERSCLAGQGAAHSYHRRR